MKTIFRPRAFLLVLSILIFLSPSCIVIHDKDNGKHRGWFKHHPKNSKSPNPGNKKR